MTETSCHKDLNSKKIIHQCECTCEFYGFSVCMHTSGYIFQNKNVVHPCESACDTISQIKSVKLLLHTSQQKGRE